jgi:signal transduction histidine kinase
MRQLFNNLLANALKFTRKGILPVINITADRRYALSFNDSSSQSSCVCITVKDNGIGFHPEYASKIFDIFQRLHNQSVYEGTGIGLAMCKKIVENHNGTITAYGIEQGAPRLR